jgi:hypothetical protein
MDFFEAQERAHRRTHRLIILFVFAVFGTIAAGYFSALFLRDYTHSSSRPARYSQRFLDREQRFFVPAWWDPKLFVGVTFGTLAVAGCASLYK